MALILTKGLNAIDRAFTTRTNPVRRPKEYAEQVLGPLAQWAGKEAAAAAKSAASISGGNTKTGKTDLGAMLAGTNKKLDASLIGEDWIVEGIAMASAGSLYELAKASTVRPERIERKKNKKTGKTKINIVKPMQWNLTPEEWERVRKTNFCPEASEGCMLVCLRNSGQMVMEQSTDAQIRRSMQWIFARPSFMAAAVISIANFYRSCRAKKANCAFRLNITSDIDWENKAVDIPDWMCAWLIKNYNLHWLKPGTYRNVCEVFNYKPPGARWPAVQFYDYTKVRSRIRKFSQAGTWPSNYWLTWSLAEGDANRTVAAWVLANQITSVTVPFARDSSIKGKRQGQPLPLTLTLRDRVASRDYTFPVLDGDAHDLRFLDAFAMQEVGTGAFIGLHFKQPNDKKNRGKGAQAKAAGAKGFIVMDQGDHPIISFTPNSIRALTLFHQRSHRLRYANTSASESYPPCPSSRSSPRARPSSSR